MIWNMALVSDQFHGFRSLLLHGAGARVSRQCREGVAAVSRRWPAGIAWWRRDTACPFHGGGISRKVLHGALQLKALRMLPTLLGTVVPRMLWLSAMPHAQSGIPMRVSNVHAEL